MTDRRDEEEMNESRVRKEISRSARNDDTMSVCICDYVEFYMVKGIVYKYSITSPQTQGELFQMEGLGRTIFFLIKATIAITITNTFCTSADTDPPVTQSR